MSVEKVINNSIFLFENFVFDCSRNLLTSDKEEIKLSSAQSRLLILMLQNSNQVLSRDIIESHVWNRGFPSQASVNNKISELRKLLKDDYRKPLFIKTHNQLGYEFICSCVHVFM